MGLQKKDFIEIEFTGKTSEGEIFDSNIKEVLEKIPNSNKDLAKKFIYCLGEGMFLEGVDNYLIGKEIGKHIINLKAEQAFGKRNPKLIQMIPMKVFIQHKINPVQGAMLNFDGKMGKVLSVSGGRVLVDFNNPLAGKDVVYEIDVKKKIDDINEKIKSFNDFIFKKDFKFEIKDKKVFYEVDETMKKFVEMFKDKFKDIFDMDLEVKVKEDKKKEDKKE